MVAEYLVVVVARSAEVVVIAFQVSAFVCVYSVVVVAVQGHDFVVHLHFQL